MENTTPHNGSKPPKFLRTVEAAPAIIAAVEQATSNPAEYEVQVRFRRGKEFCTLTVRHRPEQQCHYVFLTPEGKRRYSDYAGAKFQLPRLLREVLPGQEFPDEMPELNVPASDRVFKTRQPKAATETETAPEGEQPEVPVVPAEAGETEAVVIGESE